MKWDATSCCQPVSLPKRKGKWLNQGDGTAEEIEYTNPASDFSV